MTEQPWSIPTAMIGCQVNVGPATDMVDDVNQDEALVLYIYWIFTYSFSLIGPLYILTKSMPDY